MKSVLTLGVCLGLLCTTPAIAISLAECLAAPAIEFYLEEVALDEHLTPEQQQEKVQVFKTYASQLTPEVACVVKEALLNESRGRVVEMIQSAGLDLAERAHAMAEYDTAIANVQEMDVETARQILFFVAELKIHRAYVYAFGVALGCPERQLLRHDLCKLNSKQLEGYARYFRGGKREEDRPGCLEAWLDHQLEEHHVECYTQEGFDFDKISAERLRDNMREVVADCLASSKQRGGTTLIDWLVNCFPKHHPHPRLIPDLAAAFMQAHQLYLAAEANPDCPSIFKGLPCWNDEVAAVFQEK